MECATLCLAAAYCDSFNLFWWGWNDLYQGPVILILLFKGWWLLCNPIRTKWRHCHIFCSVWGSSRRRDGSLLQYGHYKWDLDYVTPAKSFSVLIVEFAPKLWTIWLWNCLFYKFQNVNSDWCCAGRYLKRISCFIACSLTGYHMIPDSTNFISVSPGSYGSLTDQAIDECRNQCNSRKGEN